MKALALKIRQNKIFEETDQKHSLNIRMVEYVRGKHIICRVFSTWLGYTVYYGFVRCVLFSVSEMTAIYLRFPYVSEEDLDKILNG